MKQSVYVRMYMYHSKQEHTILLDYISAYYAAISKIAYGLNKVGLHIHLLLQTTAILPCLYVIVAFPTMPPTK